MPDKSKKIECIICDQEKEESEKGSCCLGECDICIDCIGGQTCQNCTGC